MAHDRYVSNVYLYGNSSDKGYPIDSATVTIQAGMKSGSVLELSGGKYIWVVAANVANAVAVLADSDADVEGGLTAGDHTLNVIARDAGVAAQYLNFADTVTSGEVDTAKAALLAKGIKSETSI